MITSLFPVETELLHQCKAGSLPCETLALLYPDIIMPENRVRAELHKWPWKDYPKVIEFVNLFYAASRLRSNDWRQLDRIITPGRLIVESPMLFMMSSSVERTFSQHIVAVSDGKYDLDTFEMHSKQFLFENLDSQHTLTKTRKQIFQNALLFCMLSEIIGGELPFREPGTQQIIEAATTRVIVGMRTILGLPAYDSQIA